MILEAFLPWLYAFAANKYLQIIAMYARHAPGHPTRGLTPALTTLGTAGIRANRPARPYEDGIIGTTEDS